MHVYLAPMEGVVDYTLRQLLTAQPGLHQCVTEFVRVSDRLLPKSSFYRLAPELAEGGKTRSGVPVFVQLLGSDPDLLAVNAQRAVELGALGVDLNFGCPAKTVNKSRGGAVLLKEPETLQAIVTAVRQAVPAAVPVTAKMRLGYIDKSLAIENAQAIEAGGAQRLFVHARTKLEGYKPPAHWEWIARLAQEVKLPLVANGEVWSLDDYLRCQQVSGCVEVMIGRGLLANPFLAEQIAAYHQGHTPAHLFTPEATWPRLVPMLIRYHKQVFMSLSERHVHGRLKQWLAQLQRHYPQAEAFFQQVRKEKDPHALLRALEQLQSDSASAF